MSTVARALDLPLSRSAQFRRADAIVILGSRLTASGDLTGVLEERVRAGVDLFARGAAPLVCVCGGGPVGLIEADAMAHRAAALGVPTQALRIERGSRSTAQNASGAARLLAADNVRIVWLVSQPFHLRRAVALFRGVGFEALPWRIDDSIQYREPRRALRWIAREYAAWVALYVRRSPSGPTSK